MNAPRLDRQDGLAIGDVVTLRDRVRLMTVEGVSAGRFGLSLDLAWFDDNALRFETLPAAKIDLYPRDIPHHTIKIGTEVRLRSRGPVMTVRGFKTVSGVRYARCEWSGPAGNPRQRLFPMTCLVLTLLERFED